MLIRAPTEGKVEIIFSIFFNMKVHCVFSLESPHRGDSNEYTKCTMVNIKKKKITLKYLKSAAIGFFKGLKNGFEIALVKTHRCSSH